LLRILKQKPGEKEAGALVSFVDSKLKESNEANLKILVTKEDIARTEGKLEARIAESKSAILKWMFGVFIALMPAVIGLYFKKQSFTPY